MSLKEVGIPGEQLSPGPQAPRFKTVQRGAQGLGVYFCRK